MTTETRPESPAYPFAARDGVDPDPGYADARMAGAPVPVFLGGGRWAWLATTMADVRTVHTDPRFSRAAAAGSANAPSAGLSPPAGSLLALDPPDHTRMRGLVAGAFSARRMAQLRPKVAERARGLLAARAGDDPADLVAGYARPLSAGVIGALLGVPESDHERFFAWAQAFLSTAPGSAPEIGRARGELAAYFGELLGRRARSPEHDLLSHLAAQDADPRELVLLAMAILVAGHETTSNHLASSLMLLLSDPGTTSELRGDPEGVGQAVEELLRAVSLGSVGGFPRRTTESVVLSGVTIEAGDLVIPALNAANRDPAAFPQPDDLDFARFAKVPPTHVAFGAGPHFCLGAALARIELAEGVSAVLDHYPEAELATPAAELAWTRDSLVRGLVSLPVRLGPATSSPSAETGKENQCTAP
ncbi:cytochrome P450 [Amycolatopsis sp. QT-25]|uniref:cytochrome P450 n=1 Tax=Amycolatopsis sp. QT-25 TaxID=3034022 RepID=UPI0023EB80FA|nr:cytochrome P450 [Amycolatopsis sp. QT-25]WET76811.1 cytochrome P450 [Amycolatopsis sp. QT-25]